MKVKNNVVTPTVGTSCGCLLFSFMLSFVVGKNSCFCGFVVEKALRLTKGMKIFTPHMGVVKHPHNTTQHNS